MINEEFSNEFDVLTGPVFDEYEKSVFLTRAQETIVTGLYNGTLKSDSFEKTEELRRYLDSLVKTEHPERATGTNPLRTICSESVFFKVPKDLLFITYESVISKDEKLGCAKGTTLEVVPVTQDEFHRIRSNPFRTYNNRRVLRLDSNDLIELVSKFSIDDYLMRYVARPEPIILVDLPNGLTINKSSNKTECGLHPALHRIILEMAVNLALQDRAKANK